MNSDLTDSFKKEKKDHNIFITSLHKQHISSKKAHLQGICRETDSAFFPSFVPLNNSGDQRYTVGDSVIKRGIFKLTAV